MEFQAYPSACKKDRNVLLKVQNVLHSSDSIMLPAMLLAVGSSLVLYQHVTDSDTSRHSVRNFLAKILVSMLPLAILERKILQCPDPIALFAKFSAKVMLMHASFLFLRLACLILPDMEVGYKYCNIVAFLAGCIMLRFVFGLRLSLASLIEHRDVWCLTCMTCMVAFIEVSLLGKFGFHSRWARNLYIEDLVLTASDYTEILAFVPAVWMAARKDAGQVDAALEDSQRRALGLFGFLVAFYVVEDLCNAVSLRQSYPLATCGHVAHFVLLLDFVGFILAHLYDPEKFAKIRSSLMSWVSDVCAV